MLDKLRVQKWVDFCRAVRAGASVGRVAATVLDRYERRTKTGNKMGIVMLSDQTGHFEAIVFSGGAAEATATSSSRAARLVLVLQAGLEGDEVRARIQSAESLDEAVARHQKGMRIFLRTTSADRLASRAACASAARARSRSSSSSIPASARSR